jgi:Mg/Co/Ni transporter MgtE
MDVLISLTIISVAEDATVGITWRELLAEIAVGVLIHLLISITVAIVVVIPMTRTTSVSTITVATAMTTITTVATTTTVTAPVASRVDWGWTIARIKWLLVTWVF